MVKVDGLLFRDTLSVMKRVTAKCSSYIMTFTRIACRDGLLLADCYNGSIAVSRVIGTCDDGIIESFGVPIGQTLATLSRRPTGMVEVESGRIVVNGMTFQLDRLDGMDEWPVSMSEVDSPVSVMSDDMTALCGVVYASCSDGSRFNMDAVCIDGDWAVATDGARLAIRSLSGSLFGDEQVVIPRSSIKIMANIFTGNDYTRWSLFDEHIIMADSSWTVRSNRLIGFPEYKRVLLTEYTPDGVYIVNRKELIGVLKRFKALVTKKDMSVRVLVDGNQMAIARNGSECGILIDREDKDETSHSWLINYMFLLDSLVACSDDKVVISEYNSRRCVTITGDGVNDLIMLLREKNS